jgi:hypothetical protein
VAGASGLLCLTVQGRHGVCIIQRVSSYTRVSGSLLLCCSAPVGGVGAKLFVSHGCREIMVLGASDIV